MLLDERPGGEPAAFQAPAWPLGTVFAFDEIGWLETEAMAARLRAAWPMRSADHVTTLADARRAVPALQRLADHPRLQHAGAAGLTGGRHAGLAATWLLFDGAAEPPLEGEVRIVVAISGDQRGKAWQGSGAPATGIRFVADYAGVTRAAPRIADDALWPCALACAG